MGQVVTRIYSSAIREVKMYNIERRAEKVISKDKPTPAPKYPSTVKELDRLKEENISMEHLHRKDEQLDDYLKKVYVTTPDPAPKSERPVNADRPLPLSRHTDEELSFGYSESEEGSVPLGRVSLKQALQFISDNQSNPDNHSSSAIAAQYKLDINTTNDILEHFKMFNVHVQKKEVDPALMSAYDRLQLKIKHMSIYNAPEVLDQLKMFKKKTDEKGIEIREIKDISPDVDVKKDSNNSSNTEDSKKNR
uniref:NADH dehydrogenase [ubiquinone] 1 alpha subcomplex assembly factor 4 n=1 Tax=Graphocephala atropunctata TaxID=36148 RepID=A0A1B6K9N0_9HEMI